MLLRGALDGLAAIVPYGDPTLAALRGDLLPPAPGQPGGALDLHGFFALCPALAGLHALYQAGELLPVHAVASATRSRSHFEAQDDLESGADHRLGSGWLNRAVAALPTSAASATGGAMAVGVSVPLLLRGPALVGNWAPASFAAPQPALYAQIAALHDADKVTGPAIAEGLRERGFSAEVLGAGPSGRDRFAFPVLAGAAGRMLRAADGPRIAALEIGGWTLTRIRRHGSPSRCASSMPDCSPSRRD